MFEQAKRHRSCATVCIQGMRDEKTRIPCDSNAPLRGTVRPYESGDSVAPDAGDAWVFAIDAKVAAYLAKARASGAPTEFLLEPIPANPSRKH